jgi:hypothetical protein
MINFSTFPLELFASMRFHAVYVRAPQTAHMTGKAVSAAARAYLLA